MAYDPHIIGCITPRHLVYHAFCIGACLSSLEAGRLHDRLLYSFEYPHVDKIAFFFLLTACQQCVSVTALCVAYQEYDTLLSCILPHYVCWRFDWPRVLWRGWARVLALRVRIPPGPWMFVFCKCCVLQRSLRRVWSLVQRSPTECGVSECDREASIMRPWPTMGSFIIDKVRSSILSVTQIMLCWMKRL
jgi:hypothetical protein